jgi:hypothetical protein
MTVVNELDIGSSVDLRMEILTQNKLHIVTANIPGIVVEKLWSHVFHPPAPRSSVQYF